MLYITINNETTFAWEIGDDTKSIINNSNNIQTIMACGSELELIKERFGYWYPFPAGAKRIYTIAIPHGNNIIWYGDIAKTIISNIMY